MDNATNTAVHLTMATFSIGAVAGWLPVILGIPASIYYSWLLWDKWKARKEGKNAVQK